MNEHRITLVSDVTAEFPNNTNSDFTVRLKDPLELNSTSWRASLLSVTVPSAARHDATLFDIFSKTIFFKTSVTARPTDGSGNIPRHTINITLDDILTEDHPIQTGSEFWWRVNTVIQREIHEFLLKTTKERREPYYVHVDDNTVLTRSNNGCDIMIMARKGIGSTHVQLHKNVAMAFAMLKYENSEWKLGPNLTFTNPHDDTNKRWNSLFFNEMIGGDKLAWSFDESTKMMTLHRFLRWNIANLNPSFDRLKTNQTIFIYSDLIDSSYVGGQQHQLLREVHLGESKREGRLIVEPHRLQWIHVRPNRVETIQVQLATLSGPLVRFDKGKTVVTLLLQQV